MGCGSSVSKDDRKLESSAQSNHEYVKAKEAENTEHVLEEKKQAEANDHGKSTETKQEPQKDNKEIEDMMQTLKGGAKADNQEEKISTAPDNSLDNASSFSKAARSQTVSLCFGCGKEKPTLSLDSLGRKYHADCLLCIACDKSIGTASGGFVVLGNEPYCSACGRLEQEKELAAKAREEGKVCKGCDKVIIAGAYLELDNEMWHTSCHKMKKDAEESRKRQEALKTLPGPSNLRSKLQASSTLSMCGVCGKLMPPFNMVEAMGSKYHPDCFKCFSCKQSLAKLTDGFVVLEEKPYCVTCSKKKQEKEVEDKAIAAGNICKGCSKPIVSGSYLELGSDKFHSACLKCHECCEVLNGAMFEVEGKRLCEKCKSSQTIDLLH